MNQNRLASSDMVRLLDEGSAASLSEWQLLQHYLAHRDELAFETLVSRFGPMVLGTCRRMLGDTAEVDDAFQATFLVFVRRARSLGPGIAVGAWLHGVAVRVSQQARASAARRRRWERLEGIDESAAPAVENSLVDAEVRDVLDEEIHRLPWKYRAPVVLCYLEGQTHEGAARQLEWPLGTVKGRLSRARALLEARLTRRGLACGSALVALAAGQHAPAAVPHFLLATTGRAAIRLGTGKLTTHVVSSPVARLVQGVLSTMVFQKLKLVALCVVVSGLALTGAGVLARQQGGGQGPQPGLPSEGPERSVPGKAVRPVEVEPSEGPERSVPGKAVRPVEVEFTKPQAQPPEVQLRRELIEAARLAYLGARDRPSKVGPERVQSASRLLMEAERDAAPTPEARLHALEGHVERMKDLARMVNDAPGTDDSSRAEARAFVAQAGLLLSEAKRPKPPAEVLAVNPPVGSGTADGPGKDARSLAILTKLEEPIAMSFPNETPLEDVIKYIKVATQGSSGTGIPIYVDPQGLQEADKTLTSPIALDLENIPLRRTLQLLLNQLGLVYFVDDGILVITSESSEQTQLRPTRVAPTVFMRKQERFEHGEMDMKEMKDFAAELTLRKQVLKGVEDLNSRAEGGHSEHPGALKADQLEPLLKEVRELLAQLKSEREARTKSPAK